MIKLCDSRFHAYKEGTEPKPLDDFRFVLMRKRRARKLHNRRMLQGHGLMFLKLFVWK